MIPAWPALADRALRTAIATFGQTVVYHGDGANPVTLTGIFDAAHESVELDVAGVPVSTRQPELGLRLADLPVAPQQGDHLEIDGTAYVVVDVRPDGQGGARLALQSGSPYAAGTIDPRGSAT